MILDDIKQLKAGQRELRRFGLMVGGVFAALGIVMWLRGRAAFPWLLAPGAALMALGLGFPKGLKQVYIAWMSLAIVLGFVVSHVILTLFFFLVITPVGLAARLFGKDFLSLLVNREAPTYWIRRERAAKSKAEHEQQF
jgi:hypothetical protein